MTVISAIIAAAGIALSTTGTINSFSQASSMRKVQQKAEEDAKKYMDDARKRLDVNYFRALSIQKEPYELERNALISAGAQALEAGREEGRGAVAVAGRVQMAQNEAEAGIRTAMSKEQSGIEKLVTAEDSRLRDYNTQLDIQGAMGEQVKSADAWAQEQQATKDAWAGVTSTVQQAASFVPLFAKDTSAQLTDKLTSGKGSSDAETVKSIVGSMGTHQGVDTTVVNNMDTNQFKDFLSQQNPDWLKSLLKKVKDPNALTNYLQPNYSAVSATF